MTGKIWDCGQCGRTVNRFVNGYTCPDCGWTCGRTLAYVNPGP